MMELIIIIVKATDENSSGPQKEQNTFFVTNFVITFMTAKSFF